MPNLIQPDVPYKAFSGANIHATIGNRVVGTLQAVTVSITREVAALYGMGTADPRAFVKGKRGIAGSLVFTQFDRHALLQDVFQPAFQKPLREKQDFFTTRFAQLTDDDALLSKGGLQTRNFVNLDASDVSQAYGSLVESDLANHLVSIYQMVGNRPLRYSDQIPEFDLTLTMVNESGDAAFTVVGGITLVNEGWGYTVDDLTSDTAYTYVARYVSPLTSLTNNKWWKEGLTARGPAV